MQCFLSTFTAHTFKCKAQHNHSPLFSSTTSALEKQNHNTDKSRAKYRFFRTGLTRETETTRERNNGRRTSENQQHTSNKTNYPTIFQHITKRATNNINIKDNKERKQHNPTPANSITNSHTTSYITTDYHTIPLIRKETPETKN